MVVEGGARRPTVAPELAAWRVLLASHQGELGPVVATCAACAQPMVADDPEAPAIEWVVRTPEGDVAVKRHGIRFTAPSPASRAAIGWAEANALVLRSFPPPRAVDELLHGGGLVQSGMMLFWVVPMVIWFTTATSVILFVTHQLGLHLLGRALGQ